MFNPNPINVEEELKRRAALVKDDDELWEGSSSQPDIDDAQFPIEEDR